MNITELYESQDEESDNEYVNPAEDHSVPQLNDLRKTKLTLGQINRLRLIRDVRNFELKNSLENIRRQYGRPADAEAGGF
jgi:hypothetical protein